ncbi:MAG: hypothetical protein KAT05_06115 [Spirochaetes bacterium]|nr:hypothetical protein [Spirochaetota bacterium]
MAKYIMIGNILNKSIKNIFDKNMYPLINEIYDVEKISIESIDDEIQIFKEFEHSREILENRINNTLEVEFDYHPYTKIRQIEGTHAIKEGGKYQIFGTSKSSFSRYFCKSDIVNQLEEQLGDQFKKLCDTFKNTYFRNGALYLTSNGTLDLEHNLVNEINYLNKISQGKIAIITGWDWQTKGSEIRESYRKIGVEPLAIYTEGGTKIYIKGEGKKTYDNLIAEDYAKKANVFLIKGIYNIRPNAILRAQNNEIGYCYYIDVDSKTAKQIKLPFGERKTIKHIKKCLIDRGINHKDIVEGNNSITINNTDIYDESNLLEHIYRVFGGEMTFLPFRLKIYTDSILIDLVENEPDEPIEMITEEINDDGVTQTITKVPEEIEDIVKETIKIIRRAKLSEADNLIKRIATQNDICIDVFVHPKDWLASTWSIQLDKLGLTKKTNVIYLTKGTESDLSFLDNLYEWANINETTLEVVGYKKLPSIFRTKKYFRTLPNTSDFYDVVNALCEERK